MPSWITIFHLYLSNDAYARREEFWAVLGISLAFCALLIAMISFGENARTTITDKERCINAKLGVRLLGVACVCLLLGNYAGMLAAIAALFAFFYMVFKIVQGIFRSFGSCKTSA